jgi:hypothetical protein
MENNTESNKKEQDEMVDLTFSFKKEEVDYLTEKCDKEKCSISDFLKDCINYKQHNDNNVPVSDYEKEISQLQIAFNSVGLNVTYITTDLINKVIKCVQEKKGEMTIMDGCKIKSEHEDKWVKYFKSKKEKKK